MCVGINPNLPGSGSQLAHPYFEDYLQYAHYFRYRVDGQVAMPKAAYEHALAGRQDGPAGKRADASRDPGRSRPVTMYLAYQSLLDGLAEAEGWPADKLMVGEDLSYANMVACPPRLGSWNRGPRIPSIQRWGRSVPPASSMNASIRGSTS